jgi:hypothetical protein
MGWRLISKEESKVLRDQKTEFLVLRDDEGKELQVKITWGPYYPRKIEIATSKRILTFTKEDSHEFFSFLVDVLIEKGG